MKTKLFLIALAAASLIGCSEKTTPEKPLTPEEADYIGTVSVFFEGTTFDNENIEVSFDPSDDGKTASITLHKIKFVPQMPVTIDVTIPNVEVGSTTEKITLSCAQVIPKAMGGDYPRYTVTNLLGEILGKEMSFSLNFGSYPTSFRGVLEND